MLGKCSRASNTSTVSVHQICAVSENSSNISAVDRSSLFKYFRRPFLFGDSLEGYTDNRVIRRRSYEELHPMENKRSEVYYTRSAETVAKEFCGWIKYLANMVTYDGYIG